MSILNTILFLRPKTQAPRQLFCNDRIVTYTDRIQHLGTGHVGILKGELPYQLQSVKGIVHRSPEISQTSVKRVILRVDI